MNRIISSTKKLIILFVVYVFPIIHANVYYNDDLSRSLYGLTGWKGDGRPLSEYIIIALSSGRPIIDTSPLPLLLGILVLSVSLAYYSETHLSFIDDHNARLLAISLVLINPFSLQCLSYRFDCVFMYLALSIPFFVFAIPEDVYSKFLHKNTGTTLTKVLLRFLMYFFATVAVLSLYQPALGMMLVLLVVELCHPENLKGKIHRVIIYLLGIFTGSVFYKMVVAAHYVDKHGWRHESSQLLPIGKVLLTGLYSNISSSTSYIILTLTKGNKWYVSLYFIVTILVGIMASVKYCHNSSSEQKLRIYLTAVLLLINPICIFFLTFLPLMVLNGFFVRNRVFISLGGFLAYIVIMLLFLFPKRTRVIATITCIFILHQFTIIYSYGNALQSQNEYQRFMAYNVVQDIESLNSDKKYTNISIVGRMPQSREVQTMCSNNPLLSELVPIYITNDGWLGGALLYHYMHDEIKIVDQTEDDDKVIQANDPLISNLSYKCYENDDKIILVFN